MRVKCLAKEHITQLTQAGLKPGPLDPESSALNARPPRLPRWDVLSTLKQTAIVVIVVNKYCIYLNHYILITKSENSV